MKTIVITGGTGSIGQRLIPLLLEKRYRIIIFTRNAKKRSTHQDISYATWDPDNLLYDKEAIEKADAIINLAGAGIADRRWTRKRKSFILDSRINSSKTILKALAETSNHVETVINASAIGFYGAGEHNRLFTEDDTNGKGLLCYVCRAWENQIMPVKAIGKRLIILRIGIVLDRATGAYQKFRTPLNFRVATILGNGNQMMSWIHIDDLCRVFMDAIEDNQFNDIYNCCAPNPVTNKTLLEVMGRERYRRSFLKMIIPAAILKMMFGQMAEEALLHSASVSCEKLLKSGFQFRFNRIEEAVKDLEGH